MQVSSCLQSAVDRPDDGRSLGVNLAVFVGGEPCFDFSPTPQRVSDVPGHGRREPAGAPLRLDELVDRLAGSADPLGDLRCPDQLVRLDSNDPEARDFLDQLDSPKSCIGERVAWMS